MVLDDTVKRKINNARDILVGKVPDPKAQIEQITIALIYKFMDDMDKKLGTRIYFKNELKNYSWDAVLNEKDSATFFEKYVTAIDLFQRAEHFPKFFQEVFKNAYVPYKDSRTLKLFLTEMNYFDYDHSEKLGDAFEYLLSVMGSQGDAGQFRTPRHIIDFIVDIFEPQIGEKILDPACGTAGFLISAVKNMQKQVGSFGRVEINRIRDNLFGFDISPDMVRLALVNMFLHGFSDPQIEEFDTLSSDKKWNDRYDLILANPPFMSPKGGIEPHDLLLTAMDSKRAEVLFTSYILTHLKEKGRAGIIVPEGIIFQSGKAYKKLREELINNGLFGVVSLPSGVFNPYSGVKTSILLIDKNVKSGKILFVKVESDGLDLGSQRRDLGKGDGDLTKVKEIIKEYVKTGELSENSLSHLVLKSKIAENEWNLSGDRYKEVEVYSGNYPMVELGELINMDFGVRITKKNDSGTKYPVYGGGGNSFFTDSYNREDKYVISRFAMAKNCVRYVKGKFHMMDSGFTFSVKEDFKNKLLENYIGLVLLKSQKIVYACARGNAQKNLENSQFKKLKIPLPPIEIQKKIVEEIESYQKIIDGAKLVVDNYKPRIEIDKEWEMKELGEVCTLMTGGTPTSTNPHYYGGKIKWLVSGDIHKGEIFDCEKRITQIALKESNAKFLPINSVLIALNGQGKTRGTVALLRTEATCNQSLVSIKPNFNSNLKLEFLYLSLKGMYNKIRNITGNGERSGLNMPIIRGIKIPLPPLEIQQKIVKEIENEQKLIDSNKELIEIFNKKIEKVINKVWEE